MSAITRGPVSYATSTTLGTVATVALIAAKFNAREFLQICNCSASNTMAYTLDGSTPVINGNGIQLAGGASKIYDTFVPTGPVTVIGSAESTAYTIEYN